MIVEQLTLKLADAPFKTTDAALLPEAGSCVDCPKRTGNNPALFADIGGQDTCTDRDCFRRKLEAHLVQITTVMEQQTGKPALRLGACWHPTGKGVLGEQHWREAEGVKACPHAQKGVVVEADSYGSGPRRLWKVLTVCGAEKSCTVHFPHGAGYGGESDEQRKARERGAHGPKPQARHQ